MTDDPVRLLDESGSDLLRSLISAGREEAPEAAAMQRTLAAVGLGVTLKAAAAASGASGASAAASGASGAGASGAATTAALGTAKGAVSSTALIVVKWLAIGAVTGTFASSAAYGVAGVLAPPPAPSAAQPHSEPTPVAVQASPRAATVQALPDIPRPPAVVAPAPQMPAEPVASQPKPDLGAPLAAEVAALDGARQALRSGDAARTIELLNGYEESFPEARMLPEVLYLRLEAFTLKGDKSSAEAVARRILRVYPASPHAARARTVLGLDK